MSKHGVIIRLWHSDRKEQEWRIAYFQAITLPRLQRQTRSDFDIAILSPPQDHERLMALDSRIKPFTLKTKGFKYKKQGNFYYKDTKGLKEYEIQTRIDSDDLVSPDFVKIIETAPERMVTFQPELFLWDSLQVKRMRHRYHDKMPSMFLSIKGCDDCIYHKPFLRFRYPCQVIGEGHAWMSITGHNVGTTKES